MPRHKGDRGFEIVLADDPGNREGRHKKVIEQLENFFLLTGWKTDPLNRRDDLAGWLSKIIQDMLILNAPATELVYSADGRLSEFWAVDGSTIEIQWAERYIPTTRYGRQLDQPVAYVQVVDGQIQTEYAADELAYYPMHPVTNIEQGGYGISMTEYAIDWIAAEVLALQYNSNYFDHGSVPPGILAVIGNYTQETIDELNMMWETDVKGVVGQHKPVALALQDGKQISWIPMKQSNRDMEMGDFLDKLTTRICSIFNVDPVELGQRSASNTGGMSASENTEAKIDLSRDKGLLPILDWLERYINRFILPRVASGYYFRWTGINAEDEAKKVDLLNKQAKEGAITAREWRRAQGLDEVPPNAEAGKWLDAPMNPTLLQIWSQENGVQQPGPMNPLNTAQGEENSTAFSSRAEEDNKAKQRQPENPEVAKSWQPLRLEWGPYS